MLFNFFLDDDVCFALFIYIHVTGSMLVLQPGRNLLHQLDAAVGDRSHGLVWVQPHVTLQPKL